MKSSGHKHVAVRAGSAEVKGRLSFVLFLSVLFSVSFFAFIQSASAAPITLAWGASTAADLSGYRVYRSTSPGSYVFGPSSPQLVDSPPAGVENCSFSDVPDTAHYYVVTAYDAAGNESGPSNEVAFAPSDPAPPASWSDYRLSVKMTSKDVYEAGVMFRYQDSDNYYRFSWNAGDEYRRLVKRVNGQFVLLAEDAAPRAKGRTYQVDITADGILLEVAIDGVTVFSVTDTSLSGGTIALYSWKDKKVRFNDISLVDLGGGGITMQDNFSSFSPQWRIVDEGNAGGTSKWQVKKGTLRQSGRIYSLPDDRGSLDKLGTYAVYLFDTDQDGLGDIEEMYVYGTDPLSLDSDGDGVDDGLEVWWNADPADGSSIPEVLTWNDYRMTLDVASTAKGALGVMFRYSDNDNYYRASWDAKKNYFRLVKREDGIFTLLDEWKVGYVPGATYLLEVVADGPAIVIFMDGIAILSASDSSHQAGGVALYSFANPGSIFDNLLVEELGGGSALLFEDFNDGDAAGWSAVDEGTKKGPSVWSVEAGQLLQKSKISSKSKSVDRLGTYVYYDGS